MDVELLQPIASGKSFIDGIVAALAAAGGGGLLVGAVKFFAARMIGRNDKKFDEYDQVISDMRVKIAVLEANLQAESKFQGAEITDLKDDLFVAHERIRLLASGINDISKVQGSKAARKKAERAEKV